nr:molybdate ABC transporter substrate-binding protein [Paenibacillus kobensis]
MKSHKAIVLSLMLILMLLLAACGSNSDKSPDTESNSSSVSLAADTADSTKDDVSDTPAAEQQPDPANQSKPLVELTVSAAASLTDALKELEMNYEQQNPNIELTFNFGASGALQKQIEQGAPADLFLSASPKNMNALVDQSLIEADHHADLLANKLVAVVPADSSAAIDAMDDLGPKDLYRIAIGIPESVPAGQYAQEALTKANLWGTLKSDIVQGKDVRQVLQYVETGNADVGFVYKTDALSSTKSKVAFEVDPASYSPIVYPAGVVASTKHAEEAEALYTYLQTDEAIAIFEKYGFSVPN